MKNITLYESGMRISFQIRDDGIVELSDFSAMPGSHDMPIFPADPYGNYGERSHPLAAVQVTGSSTNSIHGNKHVSGSENAHLQYVSHTLREEEGRRHLVITLQSTVSSLRAEYHMVLYPGISMVRTWMVLTNRGEESLGIDYVSSFLYTGIGHGGRKKWYDKLKIWTPYNSWSSEAQWRVNEVSELGLSHMPVKGHNLPDMSHNRYAYGTMSSWSTGDHLPIGIVQDEETGEIWYGQVEHSGSWEIEYGNFWGNTLYMALLGPNNESQWWKELGSGESFETVPVSFGVTRGGITQAVDEMTSYRRAIRRENEDDRRCTVVFNDYMNCLFGDPTEEKERRIIDLAADLGAEYYCIDCGWYDDGPWWDRVGEWKESKRRFPNGLKAVTDYIHEKGMEAGFWIEIEVMGIESDLAKTLPDDWFICLHGRRRIEDKRYLLDFRNPEVRAYCTEVIDRLIRDYGVGYFKIDYNVTTGPGSDLRADSPGDALLEHYRCLYDWIREQYARHPGLIIENCGSGAQRMDYGLLSLHSLQSTSDQTDYVTNALIAANVVTAVTPEQAGTWVYPYEDEREHIIYCMVTGILLRPYLSGIVWDLSGEGRALFAQGVAVYKDLRKEIPSMLPFWPLGLHTVHSEILAYGLKAKDHAYLAVFLEKTTKVQIPLTEAGFAPEEDVQAKVLYPVEEDCTYSVQDGVLHVEVPEKVRARLFVLRRQG